MGIILYIGDSKEIADNIDNIKVGNHRLAALNLKYNYKHYIEEYMPDYILLSEDTDEFEEISDYVVENAATQLIITGNKKNTENIIPGIVKIECPETWERFKKIIETIDIVDPGQKEDKKEYRFLKQEVISFYSVQGGTGKTSVVLNMAFRLKDRNMGRILIVDLNFCEGPSDIPLNLNISGGCNVEDFVSSVLAGKGSIGKNISSYDGIDIIYPPLSLYQGDRFSIDILNELIYAARNEYDLIITDLPFRYDNISLEMINISTTSVLVMTPDMRLIPRIKAFNKFLPGNQKKMAVLNKAGDTDAVPADELEDITGLTLCASIPMIYGKDRTYITRGGKPTGIIDLQPNMDDLVKKIF